VPRSDIEGNAFMEISNPPSEEEIIVKSPWEAVAQELEKWCNETGNEFLGYSRDGNKLVIKLRLKR